MTQPTIAQLHNLTDRAASGLSNDEQQRLRHGIDRLAEYENTINWMTTCTGCARVLDSCIRETERAERAEAALARIQAIADEHPAGIDTALIHEALDQTGPLTPAEEARLAQAGVDTPGCDCGHDGMGVSWHGDDCLWRRRAVDCPGRPTPG